MAAELIWIVQLDYAPCFDILAPITVVVGTSLVVLLGVRGPR